jgi:hypothetical protein
MSTFRSTSRPGWHGRLAPSLPCDGRAAVCYFVAGTLVGVSLVDLGGRPDEALRYAYEVLRLHFTDPEAHLAYMSALNPFGPDPKVTIELETAGPGSYVEYLDEFTNSTDWLILEDSPG